MQNANWNEINKNEINIKKKLPTNINLKNRKEPNPSKRWMDDDEWMKFIEPIFGFSTF